MNDTTKIKVYALGGLDENGKNLYCIESLSSIIVLDAGVRNPRHNEFSGQIVAPNIEYLKNNQQKICGIFLSHCHYDQCGALLYFIHQGINVDVYATQFTIDYLKEKNGYIKNFSKIKFKVIDDDFVYSNKDFCLETFKTIHSVPGTLGFNIRTTQGTIVYLTDFILDIGSHSLKQAQTSASNIITDLINIDQHDDILMLMCESVNAEKTGYTTPHHDYSERLNNWMEQPEDIQIISTFDNNFYAIKQIIDSSKYSKRKIYFVSQSYSELIKHAIVDGYLPDFKINCLKNAADFQAINERVCIVLAGEGQELFDKIFELAAGDNKIISIGENDGFISLSPPFPGIELQATNALDELSKTNCKINMLSRKEYRNMHASLEDIKLATALLKPKYFMPIKGLYKNYIACAKGLITAGFPKANIIYRDNGEVISFVDKKITSEKLVINAEKKYIDNYHWDVHDIVLKDRFHLSSNGIIIFSAIVDSKQNKICSNPVVQSKGLVSYQNNADFLNQLKEYIIEELKKYFINLKTEKDKGDSYSKLIVSVKSFISKNIKKRPSVIINLNDYNSDSYRNFQAK